MSEYLLAVSGESFANADGTTRQGEIKRCAPGEPVRLIREPGNPHDPGAIAVFSARGVQIGYVAAKYDWLVDRIDGGEAVAAKINSISIGEGQMRGVVLLVGLGAAAAAIAASATVARDDQPGTAVSIVAGTWDWLTRGNNLVAVLSLLLVAGCVAMMGQGADDRTADRAVSDPPADRAVSDPSADAARLVQCKASIDRLIASGDVVQTDANRIEVDDRQWADLMAAEKRAIAGGWGCVVFGGRLPATWAVMDYAVVYGRRSGKRLAMAGSEGVVLE